MVVKFETETPQNLSEKYKTFLPMLKWVKYSFSEKNKYLEKCEMLLLIKRKCRNLGQQKMAKNPLKNILG